MTDDLDERLKRLDKEELESRWQIHRRFCLEMAAKLGATSPEQAIAWAEKLGNSYILRPPGPVKLEPEADLLTTLSQV